MPGDADRFRPAYVLDQVVGEERVLGQGTVVLEHVLEHGGIRLPRAVEARREQMLPEQVDEFGGERREVLAGEGVVVGQEGDLPELRGPAHRGE